MNNENHRYPPADHTVIFSCTPEHAGTRVDVLLAQLDTGLTRSAIQKRIAEGDCLVNGVTVKANYKVRAGDEIQLSIPEPEPLDVLPEPIALDILYEDADVIVVNKPKGMVVHPAPGHASGTLVNALLYYCAQELSGINGVMRPGIVHRIDQNTTGVLVVCKNDASHNNLAAQLKEHSITRKYRAIVRGSLKDAEGTIDAPIGRSKTDRKKMAIDREHGRHAVTHYRVLERLSGFTYVECMLETGRTHQIRVHMASIGHPLLGDNVYGGYQLGQMFHGVVLEGQTLHAMVLGFVHPVTGAYLEFQAPLPAYFQTLLERMV